MGAVAWRLHETLALGLAPIVAWRRQSLIERFAFQTIPLVAGGNGPIGVNQFTDVDFSQFSFLTRFGVAWEPSALPQGRGDPHDPESQDGQQWLLPGPGDRDQFSWSPPTAPSRAARISLAAIFKITWPPTIACP